MKNKRQSRRDKKEIKVTYISSPMKVKTSTSNFRALVQELTGQDSNVADSFIAIEEENVADDERVNNKSSTHQQYWRYLMYDTLAYMFWFEFKRRSAGRSEHSNL
ncbi:hypothetical protein RIF29_27008 [Crotalaria pallida]|uniref:VQ domain-containing protein n=1 Tax=Crotalaria pallida TaxID=3830 RepID=A0AAN9ENB9_CROPI